MNTDTQTNPPSGQSAPKEQSAPEIQAKFNQNDPILQQKVDQFIAEAGGVPAEKEKIVVKPNDDFNMPNPNDTMLTEALINTDKIEVSDMEKSLFIKSLLNDEPVKFQVSLFDGKLNVELRSRSLHEQRRIFDVLAKDQKDGIVNPEDLAYFVTRMQQYCMAIMVERVNGKLFSEVSISPDKNIEETQKILHAAVKGNIEALTGIRWTAITNAMRIFEAKCAKMGTEAANQDFWTPRG